MAKIRFHKTMAWGGGGKGRGGAYIAGHEYSLDSKQAAHFVNKGMAEYVEDQMTTEPPRTAMRRRGRPRKLQDAD